MYRRWQQQCFWQDQAIRNDSKQSWFLSNVCWYPQRYVVAVYWLALLSNAFWLVTTKVNIEIPEAFSDGQWQRKATTAFERKRATSEKRLLERLPGFITNRVFVSAYAFCPFPGRTIASPYGGTSCSKFGPFHGPPLSNSYRSASCYSTACSATNFYTVTIQRFVTNGSTDLSTKWWKHWNV